MSKYRYVANVKTSWDRTTAFIARGADGSDVRVEMGEVADLDPREIADLSRLFVLEKVEQPVSTTTTEPTRASSDPGKQVK